MSHFESRDLLDHFRQEAVVTERQTVHVELRTNRSQGRRQIKVETRWERDKIIGSGAFGDVWLETRQKGDGGARRAVKVISKRRMQDCHIDFKKELLALAKFSKRSYQQENVLVEFFGWYEDLQHLYIAMEYFELGDLSQYITGSLSEEDARQITTDLLYGIRIIHQENFVHRDLKPKNIFVVQKPPAPSCWWVKIGDFGISKRAHPETELHTQIGTALYKAPEVSGYFESTEILSGYDQAVDIWSLGCVVYELLTQTLPFSDALTVIKYCDGRFPFPEEKIINRVGSEGTEFIKSLMKPNPRHRLSANDALEAPWILREAQSEPVSENTSIDQPLQTLELVDEDITLWKAAETGDLKTIQRLLDGGTDIDALDSQCWTALNLASSNGHLEVATFLVRKGASFELVNHQGDSPWHSAALNEHLEIIRLFVGEQLDPNVNVMNVEGFTPLGLAVLRNQLEMAEFLLQSGAKIHGTHAECCLNIAVATGRAEMTELFLKGTQGSAPPSRSCCINALILAVALGRIKSFHLLTEIIGCDVINEDGMTPLIAAVVADQREMIEYLVLGTHLNDIIVAASDSEIPADKFSCIMRPRAVLSGEGVKLLNVPPSRQLFPTLYLNSATPVNPPSGRGITSLIAACKIGHLWNVQLLLQHGADPNVASHYGLTPLRQAILDLNLEIVQSLLEMGANPNGVDTKGRTPLFTAADVGDVRITKCLLEQGAFLQPDSKDQSAIFACAKNGHTEVLDLLLTNFEQSVRTSNKYGVTLLHCAAKMGMIETVKFLYRKGANVKAQSINSWTPLHNAAINGHIETAKFLLEKGASINTASSSGSTPLHDAAYNGHVRMIEFLLGKGANLNALSSKHRTPLQVAIHRGHTEAVRLLLDKGADYTIETLEKRTIALQVAIDTGVIEITQLLLAKGAGDHLFSHKHLTPVMYSLQTADSSMTNFLIEQEVNHSVLCPDGKTILYLAASLGRLDETRSLLKKGADPNANMSDCNSSPLYCAAEGGHVKLVELLLDAGASDTTQNKETLSVAILKRHQEIVELLLRKGRVADVNGDISESGLKLLHKASCLGDMKVVKFLLQAGADIHATDSNGYTALHNAVQYNRSKVVEALLAAGADANCKSNSGASPLDLAAHTGRRASLVVFEERGLCESGTV